MKISNLHAGHRKRVKKEFEDNGLNHFPAHKIFEMLLFYVIPREDTNEIGHRLLERFGSISGVFDAPMNLLIETKGVGREAARYIKFIGEVIKVYMQDYTDQHNVIDTYEAAKVYMQHKFVGEKVESLYIACLGVDGTVLFSDKLSEGSPETVGIRPVDVVKAALRSDAVQVVLAHNHPHGISLPSRADISTTNHLYHELKRVDVLLYDHIIVGHNEIYSMGENNLLPEG